jgi:hypothetical protein
MRPSHIRVFDGLRITSEHMNHLQGSFQSALQEIRQVLGVGRVHYGLNVIDDGKGSLTVLPGLAFDRHQNRVTLDEPKSIAVTFPDGQPNQYVCVRYAQSEDGNVEGHPTIIWDSCDITLQAERPDENDGMICLARIEKAGNADSAFILHDLRPGSGSHLDKETDKNQEDEKPLDGVSGSGEGSPSDEPKAAVRITWDQGVAKGRPRNEGSTDLQSLILEQLRSRMRGPTPQNVEDIVVEVGDFDLPFQPGDSSLHCESLLFVELRSAGPSGPVPISDTNGGEAGHLNWIAQSTSHGEVTHSGDQVLQFGLSQIQTSITGSGGTLGWCPVKLSEQAICSLPLSVFEKGSVAEDLRPTVEVLQHIELRILVSRKEDGGLKITCNLYWQGGVTQELVLSLEKAAVRFRWEAVLGWKTARMNGG